MEVGGVTPLALTITRNLPADVILCNDDVIVTLLLGYFLHGLEGDKVGHNDLIFT